ncbi:hypothetical protein N0V82_009041 [Gnomoniopsis sp. IMI 355080]|nr:hypothetical protein N0V82_009041 [Gnomoniopsis sp. IMI 355080]
MPRAAKEAPVESPQPFVASMTTSEAFIGLHLHENLGISEALEFFVRGYIGCAMTEGPGHMPLSCAEQALKTFAHHDSWGQKGFPWDRLDRNWKNAAMSKLVYHIRDGHSLGEQPRNEVSSPHAPQAATSKRVRDNGDDAMGFAVAPGLIEGKAASSTGRLPVSRMLDLPYEMPSSSSSESPLQRAALKRVGNNSSAAVAFSSSPLSSLPSSMFKARPAASINAGRRQTRSVTHASTDHDVTHGSAVAIASTHQSTHLQKNEKEKQPANATSEILWPFDAILDSRVKGEDIEYKIKWTTGKPSWQPSLDLRDTPEEISAFHQMYPGKVGPPGWFARGVAKAEVEEVSVEE